ncbi:MAG: aminomethyl transferase family protein [Planctomycetia bacterium]|nr:aminomethyl transferase family protein [Planctomycetia bacterium]
MSGESVSPVFQPQGAVVGELAGRRAVVSYGDERAEYDALTQGAGVVDFSDRTHIELVGDDRAAFLHNLCTNDIKRLAPGQGCGAFITNVQGRTVGFVEVFCGDFSLALETAPGQAAALLPHMERYQIREKVTFHDRTREWCQVLVAGPSAAKLLEQLCGTAALSPLSEGSARGGSTSPPSEGGARGGGDSLSNVPTTVAGTSVWLRRSGFLSGECFTLVAARDVLPALWDALVAAGFRACGQAALEMARIESGTPIFGRDLSDKNFPQELARDARAISFTKGCYLGQETVARIDALGHVNQTLCGVRFTGQEIPAAGLELFVAGKAVGHVTSAAFSPRLGAPLALAYLRRGHNSPGTAVDSHIGLAKVVSPQLT